MGLLSTAVLWDVFCKVIDNLGDAGVCWRLARELAERGEQVRLWIDDPSPLQWMAPEGHARVTVVPWRDPLPPHEPGEVVIEAFGCDPPESFVRAMAARPRPPAWINLEYLSAETYVERSHGLPSPVLQGPGAGLVKRFIYPGFTERTGGLLREQDLQARQAGFDRDRWLAQQQVSADGGRLVSLFCYEPPALGELIDQLAQGGEPTVLLVTAGRAADAVRRLHPQAAQPGQLRLHFLPLLSQREYDHLLWACDLNFVRGEDSLVRALWAGKPFVWQAYPQQDQAHHDKLQAFLDWLQAPQALRRCHSAWNGVEKVSLPPLDLAGWGLTAELARRRALAAPELAGYLLQHAARPATI
jgi:uncharacterized repeat protein (TIGR03837 family)